MIPGKSFAETVQVLTANWSKAHRRFGPVAALRCLRGSRDTVNGRFARATPAGTVDVLTFSVSPGLTLAWHRCLEHALGPADAPRDQGQPRRVILGDASGGLTTLDREELPEGAEVVPILNYHHGEKLDLFMRQVCTAERVLISDDDVFWLDSEPWRWAHSTLDENPHAVVASMLPRTRVSTVLSGRVDQPMGSSCLLVRRSRWLELGLSFKIVEPPAEKGYDWFYDTGDHAHLEILRNGDAVAVAPPEVCASLATLDAVSTWILKIQKHSPHRLRQIADHSIRRQKALRTVLLAKGLDRFAQTRSSARRWPALIESKRLAEAEAVLRTMIDRDEAGRLETEVNELLAKLAPALNDEPRDPLHATEPKPMHQRSRED